MLKPEQLSTQVLDHLGLVMGSIDKLGLIDKIDQRLPLDAKKGAIVSMGQRVAAMILNGLGFIDDRLYMFPEFLSNKPVSRLFSPDISHDHFNDDALGRCLDAIYQYGTTKLFCEISFEIGTQLNLLGKTARFDTTSLSVYGQYEQENKQEEKSISQQDLLQEDFHITYGYSKDGRPDLKQMILNLATTGKANLPIWFSAHSGNASDKIILQKAAEKMKMFVEALKQVPSFLFVGDSAMYEKCVEKAGAMLWLSRVPNGHKQAREVLGYSQEKLAFEQLEKGYQISKPFDFVYKEVNQRWVVVYSQQGQESESKSLAKKMEQEKEKVNKQIWHIGNQVYGCQKDALKAIKPLLSSLRYHSINYKLEDMWGYSQAGRPKADASKVILGYKLVCQLEVDQLKVNLLKLRQGRFILATNQMDDQELSCKEMLFQYKDQLQTEKGFRFIKADAFEVSSVFLKKESRIQSLLMVMTLCLMTYNLSEYFLRQSLKQQEDSVMNQLNKATNKPSISYIFRKFHGIQVVRVEFEGYVQELVSNLKEELRRIISYFGSYAMKVYGLGP